MTMTQPLFAIAVKSFIVHGTKLLILKRRPNDPHKPSVWEIPGGRIAAGENPYDGLLRETKEETALDIEPICPLGVQHFTRDDGQRITMIIFYCKPSHTHVRLSEEHTDYQWIDLITDEENIPYWIRQEALTWKKLENKKE
ncbi:NUDIX domain-containing protein [Candidatus Woesearchaeota archaeon]|nr:NUDIX domain-containing protein [Candidatus Woesearchaeota archaeon]